MTAPDENRAAPVWEEAVTLVARDYPSPVLDEVAPPGRRVVVLATLTKDALWLRTIEAQPAPLLAVPTAELQDVAVEGYLRQQHYVRYGAAVGFQPHTIAPRPTTRVVVHGRQGWIALEVEGPPDQVAARIEALRAYAEASPEPSLADRLAAVARLHDEGVLTPDEFAAAKRKLLES